MKAIEFDLSRGILGSLYIPLSLSDYMYQTVYMYWYIQTCLFNSGSDEWSLIDWNDKCLLFIKRINMGLNHPLMNRLNSYAIFW